MILTYKNKNKIQKRGCAPYGARRGFTYIEAVIAMLLLMVCVLFLESLFSLSYNHLHKAKVHTITLMLARQKIEEVTADPNYAIASAEGNFADLGDNYKDYYYEMKKQQPVPNISNKLMLLKVTIYHWGGGKKIVDVVLYRLVPELKKYKIYKKTLLMPRDEDNFPLYSNQNPLNYGIATITVPTTPPPAIQPSGTYMIYAFGNFKHISNIKVQMTNYIYCDFNGDIDSYICKQNTTIPAKAEESETQNVNQALVTTKYLPAGRYTFTWTATASTAPPAEGNVEAINKQCRLIIIYIPDSLGMYNEQSVNN